MKKNTAFIVLFSLFLTACAKTDKPKVHSDPAPSVQAKNESSVIFAKPEIPVLCYHRITENPKGDYAVSPSTFSAHMKILSDSGYHCISPDALYDYLVYDKALPAKPFLVTFDDSRVEHSSIAAPVLEKYGFRGVFFIMTITYGKKNYMTTDQIAALSKAGHYIGLHTWDHTMVRDFKDSTDWQKQIIQPKAKLEGLVGKPVDYFAYPNGVSNHLGAEGLSRYFKLSFILATKRDSTVPLQTVRRMIVPEWSAGSMLKAMKRTFHLN